ncbi:MAG: toll/interleukin-1 receptor domain-containing protein [Cystobacterineae bacterium]|nr:toll/interleukin-1 receptor domain-containing protein [Cystobacterineae bacterium]
MKASFPVKKIFISYAHKDNIQSQVGALLQWLNRQEGIEAMADLLYADVPPAQGWQAWMLHGIEEADVVLCICGEAYKKGFEKRGGGMGVTWEGAIVNMGLCESHGWNKKYYPILAKEGAHSCVPTPLKPWDNGIALREWERIFALARAGGMSLAPDPHGLLKIDTKRPAFRHLQRETDEKQARSSTFLRLRFAERAVDYVRHEEVWQAFEGFYNSTAPFSWWLIIGGAGSGKSRTALEFCEFLKQKKWSAGFLSLENTDTEIWHTWCPQEDTLLIIDHVAREFSECPPDISRIFTTLARRAEREAWGKKRIRIVLLDREYKEQGGAGCLLEWYQWLDKNMCYQPPFVLSTVSNEGLYRIAQQTAQYIWKSPHPLPELSEFLCKLEQLDEKKRPLFAMLLAGKSNPKSEISTNEVLDFLIEQEFERSWGPAGIEESTTLLHALLLSTCTFGRWGACTLPPHHRLWNSGLGSLHEKNGENRFLFHPVEPDLLGERFVLTRAGGNRFGRIGKKKLGTLLRGCWRETPLEITFFFKRCAQDFAASDSENIANLFLSSMPVEFMKQVPWLINSVQLMALLDLPAASKIWQSADKLMSNSPMLEVIRPDIVSSLVSEYCKAQKLPEARKVFEGMAILGDTPKVLVFRAYAAFSLICGYCEAQNLKEAQNVFEGMAMLGDTPRLRLKRAKAASYLIDEYCRAENLPEAQKLFEGMAMLGEMPELKLERSKAAVHLIRGYCRAKKLKEAQKLLEAITMLGEMPELELECRNTELSLICLYYETGYFQGA